MRARRSTERPPPFKIQGNDRILIGTAPVPSSLAETLLFRSPRSRDLGERAIAQVVEGEQDDGAREADPIEHVCCSKRIRGNEYCQSCNAKS